MAPSETALELLRDIAAALQADGPVTVGTMFRSPGLRTNGTIVAFLGHGDTLIVKLPRDRAATLIAAGAAEPVTMGRRTMGEWVVIPAESDVDATRANWIGFAREGLLFVLGTR
ncbi:hypothetical protein MUG94_01780 [Arthrobacter gengyunqii]|uniref:TfoX N-terminal domain-containing protein n=1 Tax=Arthrobacter gengyunqii TaxID=2886940 RepID=A0A9X1M4V3_9MICC|nr:hypothetical protein [Arthrobacter gengyunqii]MCC3270962.1 hypothetical protein [Arthrobacter gengyunqii]UOY96547.1 hypothetical protein MUG94_01780 [Arthrobacter gengyunqii]